VLHRSGNVHDSRGAAAFVRQCVERIRQALPGVLIEVRMDSAFFSDEMVELLAGCSVEFTISVPFERFTELKGMVYGRKIWWPATADGTLRYFEKNWKPKCWQRSYRFIFIYKLGCIDSRLLGQSKLCTIAHSRFYGRLANTGMACTMNR
jgi:hypothetical protein